MQSSKQNTILIDVITGLVVVGILVFGYYTFMPSSTTTTTDGTTASGDGAATVAETVAISNSVAETRADLQNLNASLQAITTILEGKNFTDLRDLSQTVPSETIGRDYPFTKTDWRVKLDAQIEATQKKAAAQAPTPVAPAPAQPTQAGGETQGI